MRTRNNVAYVVVYPRCSRYLRIYRVQITINLRMMTWK